MRFRVFLAIVCLCFVGALLFFGNETLNRETTVPPTPTAAPAVLASLPEADQCGGDADLFEDRPLVVGFVGRPASILPFSSGPRSDLDNQISGLLFRGLTKLDNRGYPVPDLASFAVAEDGLTVTFTFDQGGRWHDGTTITAADAVFTVQALASGDYRSPISFPWSRVETTVIDTATVQMTLPAPFTPFLEAATIGLLPAHLGLPVSGIDGSSYASKPVGSGQFKIVNEWESDGFALLESTDPAYIPNVILRFYPNSDELSGDLTSNDIDLAVFLPNTPITVLGPFEPDDLALFSTPIDRSTQLLFRMDGEESGAISDPAVRKALRLATDRQTLIDVALQGQGIVVEGPWTADNRIREALDLRMTKPDRDEAAALLNEAGWAIPDEDGRFFQKEGVDLTIRLVVSNQPTYQEIATELAKQWAQLGVDVRVELLAKGEYDAAIANRAFDATIKTVQLTQDPDLYDFWSQEAVVRGQNISKWNHRPSSEALEAGRQVWEEELRGPYYKAFATFFENELPAFTLFQDVQMIAVDGAVRGEMIGNPADLNEMLSTFPGWVILSADYEERCEASS